MKRTVLWEGDTAHGHYEVVDTIYDGRPARVLYSGDGQAAQSGVAQDDEVDLLFDYNQRMFELATNLESKRILLIGGGVGTLPKALLYAMPNAQIDVVELDEGLTRLAYSYFDLPVDDRLQVYHTDGRRYLAEHTASYDLLLIDAFTHTTIPESLKTAEAFQAYADHMTTEGVLAMNIISGYYGPSGTTLRQINAAATEQFGNSQIFLASRGYSLWLPQNFVLTAQKGQVVPLAEYVRVVPAIDAPVTTSGSVLHDS